MATRALPNLPQSFSYCVQGHVAEWLRNGLQNRVPRFNSGRGLQQINDLAGIDVKPPEQVNDSSTNTKIDREPASRIFQCR
jgi:hypothetical protein